MKYTCQYDSRCGGCDMLAFDYEKQLAKKNNTCPVSLHLTARWMPCLVCQSRSITVTRCMLFLHRTAREISQAESMRPEPIM